MLLESYPYHASLPRAIHRFLLDLGTDFSSRLVGGCVRDLLWERDSYDYDIAYQGSVSGMHTFLKERGYKVISTGIRFGTLNVVLENLQVEVTMLRREVGFTGGHRPSSVQAVGSWNEDASRRDLTYNACYMSHSHLYADATSLRDLRQYYTRFIGKSEERLWEDPLRWYRYIRFCILNSSQSWSWLAKKHPRPKSSRLSKERVFQELSKLVAKVLARWNPALHRVLRRFKKSTLAKAISWEKVDLSVFQRVAIPLTCIGDSRLTWGALLNLAFSQKVARNLLKLMGQDRNMKLQVAPLLVQKRFWIRGAKAVWNLLYLAKTPNQFMLSVLKYLREARHHRLGCLLYLKRYRVRPKVGQEITPLTSKRLDLWWLNMGYIPSPLEVLTFLKRDG